MIKKTMAKRAWQRMLSGRRLDLLDPTPLDIEIEDIAHGLSFLTRWNGQTSGINGFSVAEHSLLVEHIFSITNPNTEPKWKMAALLHDAAEYVIGDLISPVKNNALARSGDLNTVTFAFSARSIMAFAIAPLPIARIVGAPLLPTS